MKKLEFNSFLIPNNSFTKNINLCISGILRRYSDYLDYFLTTDIISSIGSIISSVRVFFFILFKF